MTEPRPARAIVSLRAIEQRINKILAQSDRRLIRTRAKSLAAGFPAWTLIDSETRVVVAYHSALDALATETGVLKPGEVIAHGEV